MSILPDIERGKRLLAKHQSVAKKIEKYGTPYWDTPYDSELYEAYHRNDLLVQIGPLSAFSPETRALIFQNTTDVYIRNKLIQTKDKDLLKCSKLALLTVPANLALVSIMDLATLRIVGGTGIVRGVGEKKLGQEIGQKDASIPTAFALKFQASQELKRLPAKHIVCYVRFHNTVAGQSNQPANRYFSREVLSGMARVSQHLEAGTGIPVKAAIVDTHSSSVVDTITKHYGAKVIDEHPIATNQILRSALGSHYQLPGIKVLAFDTEVQLEKAHIVDESLGSKIHVLPYAFLESFASVK